MTEPLEEGFDKLRDIPYIGGILDAATAAPEEYREKLNTIVELLESDCRPRGSSTSAPCCPRSAKPPSSSLAPIGTTSPADGSDQPVSARAAGSATAAKAASSCPKSQRPASSSANACPAPSCSALAAFGQASATSG